VRHPEFFTTDVDLYELFGTVLPLGRQRNRFQKVDESQRRVYRRQRATLEEHFEMLRRRSDASLAFVCGPASGLCALECATDQVHRVDELTGARLRTPSFAANDGRTTIMLLRYPDFDIPQTVSCSASIRLLGISGLVELPDCRGRELDCDQWIDTVDDVPFADVPIEILQSAMPRLSSSPGPDDALERYLVTQYEVDVRGYTIKRDCYAALKTWCAREGLLTPTWPEFQAGLKTLNIHDMDDSRLLYGLRRRRRVA
jgi:hypothetical protein